MLINGGREPFSVDEVLETFCITPMAARLPLPHKTPFVSDAGLLPEATSPHAAALSLSRAFRSLHLPELIGANLQLRQRQRGLVRRVAQRYAKQGQPQRLGTVDQAATLVESHEAAADAHYEGGRGYQPVVAVWAEADLVLADEFRDGSVPARQAPLTCAKLAFAALPEDLTERYFRGDSACHEQELLDWHRAKAGTVEHTHNEVKNELGGGHVPSQRRGVNSAWFKVTLLTYNLVSALKARILWGAGNSVPPPEFSRRTPRRGFGCIFIG